MATKAYYLDKRVLVSGEKTLQKYDDALNLKEYIQEVVDDSNTDFTSINVDTVNESTVAHGVIVDGVLLKDGGITLADGANIIADTTTGSKIGTATGQKLGFFNASPVAQQTTSVTAATNVGGSGTTVKVDDTFDGYTIAKVVKALRNLGILA